MKKSLLLFFVLMLAIPLTCANLIEYQIIDEKVFVKMIFESVNNFEIYLPYDASVIEVNVDYKLEKISGGKIIRIDSGKDVEISYITASYIDKSKKYYFTTKNNFGFAESVKLYLPERGVIIDDGILFPENAKVGSDGRRISLEWINFNEEQIIVSYGLIEEDDWHYLFIICVLVFISFVIHFFDKNKFKKEIVRLKDKTKIKKSRKQEEITKNLFEDEKRIVLYLLKRKKNEAWTKEIVKETGIHKVRLSRKLRSLEAKEIIKRIPYGNENKVRLLK